MILKSIKKIINIYWSSVFLFFVSLISIGLVWGLLDINTQMDSIITATAFSLALILGAVSYSVSLYHSDIKHQEIINEETKKQKQTSLISYLEIIKNDVNNYLTFLENNSNNENGADLSKQISYLQGKNSKITKALQEALESKRDKLDPFEKLDLRTNTLEDYLFIIKEYKNIKIKNIDEKDKLNKLIDIKNYNFYENIRNKKINLIKADLTEVNLSEANLTEANLTKADLSEANLSEANLSRTNLRYTELLWAYLWKANLTEANLTRLKVESFNYIKKNPNLLYDENWETIQIKKGNLYTSLTKEEIEELRKLIK